MLGNRTTETARLHTEAFRENMEFRNCQSINDWQFFIIERKDNVSTDKEL